MDRALPELIKPDSIRPVLLADIGGTNLRFALGEGPSQPLRADSIRRYRAADHGSLGEAAARYVDELAVQPHAGVFAVAGRVDAGEVKITNLPWTVSAQAVAKQLSLASVRLVNDFAAQSRCLPLLTSDDLEVVGSVPAPSLAGGAARTVAVAGPGTGLGVGALLMRDGRAIELETEGGHLSFAPGSDEEVAVLARLRARFGRVSNERVVCGNGLYNLYVALCEIAGIAPGAPNQEAVSLAASDGSDAHSVRAVELFCEIFGAICGDLVFAFGAWDGVYLTGGLLEPMLPWIRRGGFRRRFEDKGRFSPTMAKIPTLAITHPHTGLLGAAAIALDG